MSTLEIESHRYVRTFAWSPHWEMPIPHSVPRVECPFFSTTAKESQRTTVLCIARKYTPWQSGISNVLFPCARSVCGEASSYS